MGVQEGLCVAVSVLNERLEAAVEENNKLRILASPWMRGGSPDIPDMIPVKIGLFCEEGEEDVLSDGIANEFENVGLMVVDTTIYDIPIYDRTVIVQHLVPSSPLSATVITEECSKRLDELQQHSRVRSQLNAINFEEDNQDKEPAGGSDEEEQGEKRYGFSCIILPQDTCITQYDATLSIFSLLGASISREDQSRIRNVLAGVDVRFEEAL